MRGNLASCLTIIIHVYITGNTIILFRHEFILVNIPGCECIQMNIKMAVILISVNSFIMHNIIYHEKFFFEYVCFLLTYVLL